MIDAFEWPICTMLITICSLCVLFCLKLFGNPIK